MTNQQISAALDDCLRRMENGASIEACLRSYPELAAELHPLLRAAQAAQLLGAQMDIPEKSRRKSRAGFLQGVVYAQAAAGSSRRGFRRWSAPHWRLAFTLAMIGFVIFLGLSSAMVVSAQDSLPGEPLYSVKILSENLRLWLASPAEKPQLQEEFAVRRQTERILLTQTAQPKVLSTPTPETALLPGGGQPTSPPTQIIDTPIPEMPTSPPEESNTAQEQQEDDQQTATQEAQSDEGQQEDNPTEDSSQDEEVKHLTESPSPGQDEGKEKNKSSDDNEDEDQQAQFTPTPQGTDDGHDDPVTTPVEDQQDEEDD